MTNALARNGSSGLMQGENRVAPWSSVRDLLGFDPFQNLRANYGFEYDVTRTENGYEVEVPVPGYNPAQIDVTFKDGVLTVNGKSDRRTFSRSFTIPEDVDADTIAAKVADGMLVLSLHRRPEAQPKRIEVR